MIARNNLLDHLEVGADCQTAQELAYQMLNLGEISNLGRSNKSGSDDPGLKRERERRGETPAAAR